MFTLALGVFIWIWAVGSTSWWEHMKSCLSHVGRGGLDSYSSLPGHDHSDLGLPTRPCLLKVLPAPNSENLGPCLNTWTFEGHSRSRLQQQPSKLPFALPPYSFDSKKKKITGQVMYIQVA